MPQAGIDPSAQSHASYLARALPPSPKPPRLDQFLIVRGSNCNRYWTNLLMGLLKSSFEAKYALQVLLQFYVVKIMSPKYCC